MVSDSVYKDLNKANKKNFKELVKLYDQKMYKKAFKKCEVVMKTQPEHPETLAMKALILNTVGRKKEAYELVNKALMLNLGSFTCWHIKGMIERSDKHFEDAKKWFAQSSKIEEDNQKILRDLLLLELQVRDFSGAITSISKVMQKNARNKVYVTTYFIANHLAGNYEVAENFIDQNRDFIINKLSRVELNEFHLYEATLFKDHGKYEEAVSILKTNHASIVDKNGWNELLAELYLKLNQNEEAIQCYELLLKSNPSNSKFYHGLFQAHSIDLKNLDDSGRTKIIEIIKEKIETYPKLLFIQRLLLNYLNDEESFKTHFQAYCKYFLEKGIPSLVKDIEKLITEDKMKLKIVREVFQQNLESIQKDMTIDGEEQDPLQEWFLLFYLAQVKYIEGDYIKAHELISESIEHTPTFIEAWQFKAKNYAALGDDLEAEQAFKCAHSLDTADRFLNAEWAKYVLKNGKVKEANDIMKRWSVDMATDDLNTFELQNAWYEVETGYSYYSRGKYLEAFQMFNFIQKHIEVMYQDAYDLHFYTIRKLNLRSYLSISSMQDKLRQNVYVHNGMIGLLKVCDKIYKKVNSPNEEERKEFDKWLAEEVKKHKDKEVDEHFWEEYDPPHDPLNKIPDPTGAKELKKYVDDGLINPTIQKIQLFLAHNPDNLELNYYAMEWYLRGKKYDAAIKSLKVMIEKNKDSPLTIYSALKFKVFFEDENIKLKEKQQQQIDAVNSEIFGGDDALTFYSKNLRDKYPDCLSAQRYYLQGLSKYLKIDLTSEHFQNIHEILSKAASDNDFRMKVLPHRSDMKKLIDLCPSGAMNDFINAANKVFWKLKEVLDKQAIFKMNLDKA